MVILKNKLNELNIGYYVLRKSSVDSEIETLVPLISGLSCVGWNNYLDELIVSKDITPFHKDQLIVHTHAGIEKAKKIINDATIGVDNIDPEEIKSFAYSMGVAAYFENDTTLDDMIQTLDNLGYYFQRKTSNNI